MLNKHRYAVEILKKKNITWQQQNQIHKILNIAYDGISIKFLAKTYGHIRPIERVVGYLNDEMVAHLGISHDILFLDRHHINVSCLGLWASLRQGWAERVMEKSLTHLNSQGVLLAIGISNNKIILNRVLPKFKHVKLDIPVHGNFFSSKASDTVIVFPICISDNDFRNVLDEIEKAQAIYIKGEPF